MSKQKIELTPELRVRFVRALQQVWDYIADDALALGHDGKSRDWIERNASMTRAEVGELAGDAGRMMDYGITQAEYEAYCDLDDATRDAIIREAFPHERYGY